MASGDLAFETLDLELVGFVLLGDHAIPVFKLADLLVLLAQVVVSLEPTATQLLKLAVQDCQVLFIGVNFPGSLHFILLCDAYLQLSGLPSRYLQLAT